MAPIMPNAAVLRAAGIGRVAGHRLARAAAFGADDARIGAARHQVVAHAVGALLRQRVVDGVGAGRVGVADHQHFGARLLAQALCELVQDRAQARLQVGAAGFKGNVVGDVQLELVVRRLRDLHAGAGGGGLHLLALVFHVLRPGVAAGRARCGRRADVAGRIAAPRGHGTDAGADARVALGFGHVGATGQHDGGRRGGQHQAAAGRRDLVR